MNNESNTSEYLLLFRGGQWDRGLSAEEMQKSAAAFMAWFERLGREGKVKGGQPLERRGKVISGKGGRTVDAALAESKEAIGGYFLLTVEDEEEAIAIAQQCPTLEHGAVVEVRPVAAVCPTFKEAMQELEPAGV